MGAVLGLELFGKPEIWEACRWPLLPGEVAVHLPLCPACGLGQKGAGGRAGALVVGGMGHDLLFVMP